MKLPLAILPLMLTAAVAYAATRGEATITPVQGVAPLGIARHQMLLAQVPTAHPDIVLIGDSMAQLWPPEILGPPHVLNLGVGGDRTQNVLWRLAQSPLEDLHPAHVLLQVGTNNLGDGDPPAQIMDGIDAIVKRIHQAWPAATLTLVAVTPRGADMQDYEAQRLALNALIHDHAQAGRYAVVDMSRSLVCTPVEGCPNYRPDHLHLTAQGYTQLLARLKPFLGL